MPNINEFIHDYIWNPVARILALIMGRLFPLTVPINSHE
jgi:hypothetical protein